MKPTNNNKPKTRREVITTTLKYGAVSEYTACRECGKKFYQKNTTARFRAIARCYYNGCPE